MQLFNESHQLISIFILNYKNRKKEKKITTYHSHIIKNILLIQQQVHWTPDWKYELRINQL